MRSLPKIDLTPNQDYCMCVGSGFDTIKETFDLWFDESFIEMLELRKATASETTDLEEATIGNLQFIISGRGTGKAKFFLKNDDYQIFIRSPKTKWCFSVEYTAKGLWSRGIQNLREELMEALGQVSRPRCSEIEAEDPINWQRVSRIDFAIDFYSPEFSEEIEPNIVYRIVAPSGCKSSSHGTMEDRKHEDANEGWEVYSTAGRTETVTIGRKNNLQVQLYDKSREVRKKFADKKYFYDIWAESGWVLPEDGKAKDIWRMELRFGKEFMQNRKILTLQAAMDRLQVMLTEAIFTRRLTVKGCDENRARWALHPLYTAALDEVGNAGEMLSLGRIRTQTGNELVETMEQTVAGTIRTMMVIKQNSPDFDENDLQETLNEIFAKILNDTEHALKAAKADLRYRDVQYFKKEELAA
nr:hypothetical protein 3 [bacterium]